MTLDSRRWGVPEQVARIKALSSVLAEIVETARQVPEKPQEHLHRFRLDVPAGFPARDGVRAQV